jgi:hypothetical protein
MDKSGFLNIYNQTMLSHLRIKPEYITRAAHIIEREFGVEWLQWLSAKYRSGAIRSVASFHPIYHGLLAGAVNQVTLEVLELATYLDYARRAVKNADKALPRLIEELRSEDKFHNYLFQLMVTTRFRLVVPQLVMEPSLQPSPPDITFEYLGTEFIIETTRIGQPERTKRLDDFLVRLFFWLDRAHHNERLNLRLTVKTVDLVKTERELRAALLQAGTAAVPRVATEAFEVDACQFSGTVQEFQAAHTPQTQQGKELAFATGRTDSPPFSPEPDLSNVQCRTTLVADLAPIEDELYQDVPDKIDAAIQRKVKQLKPLWGRNREIYVFVDVGEVAMTRGIDKDRILPRLRANVFDKCPGLLGGAVLAARIWDNALRRTRMAARLLFAPGQRRIENYFVFRDLVRREDYNDFIGSVVGWGQSDGTLCSCGSQKPYGECCKSIPPVTERLKNL